ncbi:MAG: hypothetical protein II661_10675 [Bacteroidales bacterium]|nr:hypothetical protein [Bacteroidales bacterium]
MKLLAQSFNKLRELTVFVNENHIPKDKIVSAQSSSDGTYLLLYYGED